jgi:hypothetical protein
VALQPSATLWVMRQVRSFFPKLFQGTSTVTACIALFLSPLFWLEGVKQHRYWIAYQSFTSLPYLWSKHNKPKPCLFQLLPLFPRYLCARCVSESIVCASLGEHGAAICSHGGDSRRHGRFHDGLSELFGTFARLSAQQHRGTCRPAMIFILT